MKKLILILLLILPSKAFSQIPGLVLNPSLLQFTVSPDHNLIDPTTGQAIITSYEWNMMAMNNLGAIVLTAGINKMSASDNATVQIPLPGIANLVAGTVYVGNIIAKGPGGNSSPSVNSNPFAVPGPIKVPATVTNVRVNSTN